MSKQKGARYERQLVNDLVNEGWFAMRSGSSGSATDNDLPDIFAGNDGNGYVIELKFTSESKVWLDEEEVNQVQRIAATMGATPLVVGRFKQDTTFYAWTPSACGRTDAGSFVIGKELQGQAMTIP